jgi:uroporphyrinogen III methyltransferase / synthase
MQQPQTSAPLAGKMILVTRAALQAGELVTEIERYGGTPVLFPTIEIRPPLSWEQCDRSIDALPEYDGLIFTSTNGVRYFCERWSARGVPIGTLQPDIICVVGEKTRQAAVALGLRVTFMPQRFTASDLARTLAGENLKGKRFLFPRGNLGDDAIPEHLSMLGALVDCVIVYETRMARPGNLQPVRTMLLNGEIDVATFTSPSTFNNFVSLFSGGEVSTFRPRTLIASIGPATAATINRHGLGVDITSPESSAESLVASIIRYYHPALPSIPVIPGNG